MKAFLLCSILLFLSLAATGQPLAQLTGATKTTNNNIDAAARPREATAATVAAHSAAAREQITAFFAEHLKYPSRLDGLGFEGEVIVSVVIAGSGEIVRAHADTRDLPAAFAEEVESRLREMHRLATGGEYLGDTVLYARVKFSY